MSKLPWPHSPNRIVCGCPASRAASASSIAALIACAGSGAGMIPSVWANWTAAANVSFWRYARGVTRPLRTRPQTSGESPW